MSIEEHISASQAKAASSDSAMLAQAGQRAQLAMQWGLAANLYDQAAEVLYLDPHTGAETIQARAHRRSAQICRSLLGTFARNRLLADCPEYGAIACAEEEAHTREWREWRES
ncbi:hypothetical protein [Comamonas sp. wu1-DMT]|uniref:hypothetical protein n=1 Tax=Comamonas sp. wu1-DMT TaxID=3126390 RepID=UPI0032E3964B